ncbi:MAG: CPBP family intramembrane glutamic endopeptidase [Phycisphaerales bacterium]
MRRRILDPLRLQCDDAGSCSLTESAAFLRPASPATASRLLAVETAAVTIGAIATVRLLHMGHATEFGWFLIPCVLVIAALTPAWIAKRDFPPVGFRADQIRLALTTALLLCLAVLPAVYLGLRLLASSGLPIPLKPVLAQRQDWASWLLYQFLYVAAAEEVFFRGYVQANATRWLGKSRLSQPAQWWIAIGISAACFALAHVVVQGQIISALTFLPGLLMAWLFARTGSLLAPLLFHGLANVSYGIMAATFA